MKYMLFRFSNWLCGFRQTSHPRWASFLGHRDGNVSLRSLSLRLVEFVKSPPLYATCWYFQGQLCPHCIFMRKTQGQLSFSGPSCANKYLGQP